MCYSKWGEIPECYERFLLQLAGDLDVAEDSNNLEGWTIQQMLSHVSGDAYVGSNVILQAIRDIRARHQNRNPLVVSVRISNVTMWRKEVADWIKSSEDHILLVQETHLGPTEAREVANYMHRQGFQMYGGISHPTDKGTKGGVAVLIKSHIQGRVEHSHLEDGCGFEAVDVRLQRTNLLVASVYLKTGTSIHTRPNSSILAELLSLVKNWKGMWIIAGDFNTPPEELAATNVLAEMNGCLCKVGVPTTDQGREIDFAIVHKALEPLSRLRIDWAVPHKPHASLTLRLDMGEGLCPAMMLEQHSQLIEGGQAEQGGHSNMASKPLLEKSFQGEWLQNTLPKGQVSVDFGEQARFVHFSVQKRAVMVSDWLARWGSNPPVVRDMAHYLWATLLSLELRGVVLCDVGPSNAMVRANVPYAQAICGDVAGWSIHKKLRHRGVGGFVNIFQLFPAVQSELERILVVAKQQGLKPAFKLAANNCGRFGAFLANEGLAVLEASSQTLEAADLLPFLQELTWAEIPE